jgi:hypothetical protein
MKINFMAMWRILFFVVIPGGITEEKTIFDRERNWKSFYIMKVIYNIKIYRLLAIKVRNVQQSLYTGKRKYIVKI